MAAAIVLIVEDKSTPRVLAISRGHDKKDWALPGGHVEASDGGDRRVTASRELFEETGVLVTPAHFRCVYPGRIPVFSPTVIDSWPPKLRSLPFEGFVAWKRPSVLCRPSASYRIYARQLFAAVGLDC